MALGLKGKIYVNSFNPNKYEINVYNIEGKLLKKISRTAKQFPYSKEEIERFKKSNEAKKALTRLEYTLKTVRPLIRRFILDCHDKLWIWTGEYDKDNNWCVIDIFDKQGRYLYKFKAQNINSEAKIIGNKLYNVEGYPDEYLRLVVYEIIENFPN